MADGLEIERKYLIAYPRTEDLTGAEQVEIAQTYLSAEAGETHRVRRWVCRGETRYFETRKRPITHVTCREEEREVDEVTYRSLMAVRDPARKTVEKVRYRLPYGGHIVEIDVYPFWRDRAILEVELSREDEEIALPDGIRVIREVTDDSRYKNVSLACRVPNDPI